MHERNLLALIVVVALAWSSPLGAQPKSLSQPVGNERWAAGSYHLVRWNSIELGERAPLRIDLSVDGGRSWSRIKSPLVDAANGSFRWKTPNTPAKKCFLRVVNTRSNVSIQNASPFSIIPSQEVDNYQWTQVLKKTPYAPRDGAGILSFQNHIYLLGGWNPHDKHYFPRICNNEVWRSADGERWDLVKPNTFLDGSFDARADWEGRHTGGYAVHDGKMWLIGGDVNQGHYQNDVWNSRDGVQWTQTNPDTPVPWGPRALHYTVAFQDKIWVLGGQTMPAFAESEEQFYRDIWTTRDGKTWRQVSPREPYWSARGMISGSVAFKGRLWILGGGTYDTPTTKTRQYLNDVWSTSDGVTWTKHTADAPWQPRQYHHVAVYDNRMWVIGGYHAGDINDVWYSSDGENWYSVFGTPWQRRHATSVVAHRGRLWLTLGSCMKPDLWSLKRSDDPAYRSPKEPHPVSLVAIKLDGLAERRVHLFDPQNPGGSPRGFTVAPSNGINVLIYSSAFGLNYLDDAGRNAYAEMQITSEREVEFVKWRDGGQQNKISVDNSTRPPQIKIAGQ
ncbi:MAG: hypothetical protein QGG36_19790 [Pirellulaceae bacterium]|nr:hypothetical protein [Pirellulaceae bacterium]